MNQLINDMLITLKFGTDAWRIESQLIFEGSYEELVLKLKGSI